MSQQASDQYMRAAQAFALYNFREGFLLGDWSGNASVTRDFSKSLAKRAKDAL